MSISPLNWRLLTDACLTQQLLLPAQWKVIVKSLKQIQIVVHVCELLKKIQFEIMTLAELVF